MPTFNENVVVDGAQDIQQLRVQGFTTQNQPLQTWENSSGTALGQVTGDGNLIVGSASVNTQMTKDGRMIAGDDLGVATPDALLEVHRAETSSTRPTRGIHSLGQLTGVLTNLVHWMVSELELRGSSAINALHTALRIRISNLNTGTPGANAELRGADIEVINDAAAGAGTLSRATGLQSSVTNAAGKTITDAVALRLKMNNAGTITNPYSIYTEGVGVAHFEDYLEVKRPTAVPGTPPTDFIRLYPKTDGKFYAKNWTGIETELGGGAGVPSGSMLPFAGATAPSGWLLCDGRAISRITYSALHTAIGDAFSAWATLTTRTSDTQGVLTFVDSNHGLAVGSATLTLFFFRQVNISSIDIASDQITTAVAHTFSTGNRIRVSSTGTLPGGVVGTTDYFIRVISATVITLHPTASDATANTNRLNLTTAGTGTHTLAAQDSSSLTGVTITSVAGAVVTVNGSGVVLPPVNNVVAATCTSGQFFVPDMRGQTVIGAGLGFGLSDRTFGQRFGSESHTLTLNELPAHSHLMNPSGVAGATTPAQNMYSVASSNFNPSASPRSTQNAGGGFAHNNMQPSLALNYIIKT